MRAGLLLIDIQNDYFEKGAMTLVDSDFIENTLKKIKGKP